MFESLPRRVIYFTEVWLYPDGRVVHKKSWSKTFGFVEQRKKKSGEEKLTIENKGTVVLE